MTEATRPRSATVLKHRLLEAHRAETAAGPDWASTDPAIEEAAATITGARRRFVVGAATSFTYASLLAAKLSSALAKVTLIDGTIVRPLDILADVHDSDLLIAISLQPYRRYTLDVAVPFVRAGGSLVAITDGADAPLTDWASTSVVVGGRRSGRDPGSQPLHPESPEVSPSVVAMVIDLITALSSASAKGAGRRRADRERLATELGLYLEP